MINYIEEEVINISKELFNILLRDRTTQKNICWATDHYVSNGTAYFPQEPITIELVTGTNANIVQPRVSKVVEEQVKRTKNMAEVFTPSWVCNEQNNLIDEDWFGRKDVFNTVENQTWKTNDERIFFPKNKNWRKYVDSKRLEISCGEAPYLVSRYDTVSGEKILLSNRIGLLDRKLRIVNENTITEDDWFFWTKRAYESTYGYEYQGDSLLIARKNLLYTFVENMNFKFSHDPSDDQLKIIARIISWNIWQMDAKTYTVPYSERPRVNSQLSIFDFLDNNDNSDKEPIPCKIYDWRSNKSLEFKSIMSGGV